MWRIEVEYLGEVHSRSAPGKETALTWAEDAVHEAGADYAVVYDSHGEIYASIKSKS